MQVKRSDIDDDWNKRRRRKKKLQPAKFDDNENYLVVKWKMITFCIRTQAVGLWNRQKAQKDTVTSLASIIFGWSFGHAAERRWLLFPSSSLYRPDDVAAQQIYSHTYKNIRCCIRFDSPISYMILKSKQEERRKKNDDENFP